MTPFFFYDAAYNRTGETSVDTATRAILVDKTTAYNNRNQHTTVTDHLDASQNAVYQYDANGNQILKNQNGQSTQFNYDVRDQLSQVKQGSTDLGRYHYDYQGLRIRKTGDQGPVNYTYDNQSVLTQHDPNGTTVAKYDYGLNRLLSLNHPSEGRQYYHFDALGSPVTLTKPDASVQARYQYDAWGHYRSQVGTSHNRFGFTGHEHDSKTGLIYAKARYYDPDTGRFLSQDSWAGDPSIAPSLHKYLYAYQNPTVYVDLDGREAVDVADGFASSIANLLFADEFNNNPEFNDTVLGAPSSAFSDDVNRVQENFKVDFRTFSVSKSFVPAPTIKQKLKSVLSLGLIDTGEFLGNTAGAISASFDDNLSDKVRNQANFDVGASLPAVAVVAAVRKASPKKPKIIKENPSGRSATVQAETQNLQQIKNNVEARKGLNQKINQKAAQQQKKAIEAVQSKKVGGATKSTGKTGEFSIVDWKGYPGGVPKPQGPVRLLEGAEYNAVRKAANSANSKIRKNNNLVGKPVDVHEIKPVKFGGSATDSANKVILDRSLHRQQVTPWWNKLQKDVGG